MNDVRLMIFKEYIEISSLSGWNPKLISLDLFLQVV